MIKFPILKTGEYLILRKELFSGQIVNNDDTPYNGNGENYYMVFDSMNELKKFIYSKNSTIYQYNIYDKKGNYIDYICLYDDNIYVKLINSLLLKYGEKRIFENESFTVGELSSDTYLHLIFERPESVQFELRLSNYEIEIQIYKAPEIFNIVTGDSAEKIFKNFITDLFTSAIKIEYYGNDYILIYFYNKENQQIRKLKYISGFPILFRKKKAEIICFPILK